MTVLNAQTLDPCPGEPLAIAFSGGGDSTALLHLFRDRLPAPEVFIVDHGLRPESRREAEAAKRFSNAQGLDARILTWQPPNLTGGLQAKARMARFGLLGQACRAAGISHLLTGHTQDDQSETLLMRYERKTGWRGAAGMRAKVFAPIWPELAAITLHRPLLGHTRKALRSYNTQQGLRWIEDPSNENRDFTRIRARDLLAKNPGIGENLLMTASHLQKGLNAEAQRFKDIFKRRVSVSPSGIIHLHGPVPKTLLAILLRAGSGTGGPIADEKLLSAKQVFFETEFKGATLGGAQIVPAPSNGVFIGPEPTRLQGVLAEPKDMPLPKDREILWNGRFWVTAKIDGLTVKPVLGHIAKLPAPLAAPVKAVPAVFRGQLPMIIDRDGNILAAGHQNAGKQLSISSAVASRLQGNLS